MDFQWGSFVGGVILGGVGAFATGFLKKAGEDAWSALKRRISPPEPEPILVSNNFDGSQYQQGNFSWVRESSLHEKEAEGYTYFRHPNHQQARCYRQLPDRKEFLMRRPD